MENFSTNFDAYNKLALAKTNDTYSANIAASNNGEVSIFSQQETTNPINQGITSLNESFSEVQDEQGLIGKLWNGFKNLTGLGLSSNDVQEKIEQYKQGEITYEEALDTIESFSDKQEGAVNLIANTITGVATAGITIATGGAGALLMGAAIGGAAKAGVKTLDRATNNVAGDSLDAKEILKDTVTGAVDGMVSAATAGIIKGPIAGQTVKQAVKQGAIQGATSGAITGGVTGAADYTVNTIADDEEFTFEGLLKTTAQNAITGAVFGGVLGGITGGVSQNALNKKVKITHSDSLGAPVDNKTQAENYIDNFNKNNEELAITDPDMVAAKTEKLSDLSKKSETLAVQFDGQLDEATEQINKAFSNKTDIEVITARAKSQSSTFSKLAKKNLEKGKPLQTMDECYEAIGDALGIRIQMKSLSQADATEIVEDALKQKGVTASFDDFVRFMQGDDGLSDETIKALSGVSDEILDALKTRQMQSAVDQLVDGIKTGSVKITELNNYGDNITSYFTEKQIQEIVDAYDYAVSKKIISADDTFEIVSQTQALKDSKVLESGEQVWPSKVQEGKNLKITQKTKGAIKDSGYTSGQMNTKHALNDGTIANGELQIRGTEVNEFADVEHIPYDIRTGKITASDSKYSEIYDIIKNMEKSDYTSYNEYLGEIYKTLRMKELGLLDKSAAMPEIGKFVKGVSVENLAKIDINGLFAIGKKH